MSKDNPSANGGRNARDRVADALRERINSGELLPGQSLPTQKALMTEFGVERGTVRQALAQLKRENLLADVTKGSPPTVAEAHLHATEAPRAAGVELAERIEMAFQAKHVTLDAFSLTTETLNYAVGKPLVDIATGVLRPRSISVRLLIPRPDTQLALPQLVSDPSDLRPLRRVHHLIRVHATTLQHSLESLVERKLVAEVSAEVRSVPITPSHKFYLLNSTEVLMGHYRVVPRTVMDAEGEMEIYDVLGVDTKLFRYSSAEDARDEHDVAFVEDSQLWFESLWSTIARPVTLSV